MTPVTMKQTHFGYFPKVFSVNGVEYTVQNIVKCWPTQKQIRFRVECYGKTLDLYRDAKQNTWHLAGAQ